MNNRGEGCLRRPSPAISTAYPPLTTQRRVQRKCGSPGNDRSERLNMDGLIGGPGWVRFSALFLNPAPRIATHKDTNPNGEAKKMVSDDDIVRALDGTSVSEAANADAINRAINGQPSVAQEAVDRAILRSLGSEAGNHMGKGLRQGDDYLAQMGMDVAKGRLREQLMKANPKLTAGAAEMRVETAAEAAYLASETHKYEADRLASVTAALEAQAQETKPNAEAREVVTYTTLDGKETATFVRSGGKSTKL